jgi:outer membrane protein assembly factor BamB
VFCYDLDGKEHWRRDLGPAEHIWGNAASPVLYRDLVILNHGPGERTFLIALDNKTGHDVWRVEIPGGKRGEKGGDDWLGSWATPVIADVKGRTELVMGWPGVVRSYNSDSGSLLWECRGLERDGGKGSKLVYASPLVSPEVVVGMAGFGGPTIAVKTGGSGDVTETHRLWRTPGNPQRIGSGVIVGDHVYVANEPAISCLELKTGKQVWSERVPAGIWGSLVLADGKLYVTDQSAETWVVAAKPKFELIAKNALEKEMTRASIAVSDGELFIRTYTHLWCITERK